MTPDLIRGNSSRAKKSCPLREIVWSAYVVEVFTDTDADLLSVGPGELAARTAEPVPLGTVGLGIELNALRD